MIFKTYFIDTFSTCTRDHRTKHLDHFLPSVGLNAKREELLRRLSSFPHGVKPTAAGRFNWQGLNVPHGAGKPRTVDILWNILDRFAE